MRIRLVPVLLVALVALAGAASRAQAQHPGTDQAPPVIVLAQSVDSTDPAAVPPGMTVVFVPPAPDGFADGGDGPGGLEWVAPDGFADGGDAPAGFIAALARPAGDDFWNDGAVPDGLVAVFAWPVPDGFADGGDVPDGFVPVLFSTSNSQGLGG